MLKVCGLSEQKRIQEAISHVESQYVQSLQRDLACPDLSYSYESAAYTLLEYVRFPIYTPNVTHEPTFHRIYLERARNNMGTFSNLIC